jgi:nucleotide-binding universal stress UspA family protein
MPPVANVSLLETRVVGPRPPARPPTRIAVPVDGSRAAQRAVHHVVDRAKRTGRIEVTLVGLAPGLSRALPRALARALAPVRAAALARTRDARELLATHRIPYRLAAGVADPSTAVAEAARAHDCDEIVMGAVGGPGPLAHLLAPAPARVAQLSQRRVTVVDSARAEPHNVAG